MRTPLVRFIAYTGCLIGTVGLILFGVSQRHRWKGERAVRSLIDGQTTWVMGDSQPQMGFDDDLIDGAVNLARFGETPELTRARLDFLFERWPELRPERVIIFVSFNSLSSYAAGPTQSAQLGDNAFLLYRVLADHLEGYSFETSFSQGLFLRAQGYGVTLPPFPDYHDLFFGTTLRDGTYLTEDEFAEAVNELFGRPELVWEPSVQAFDRMVAICQREGVVITFVAPPIHPRLRKNVPPPVVVRFTEISSRLSVLDLSELFDAQLEYFYDFNHANTEGAAVLTQAIVGRLDELR